MEALVWWMIIERWAEVDPPCTFVCVHPPHCGWDRVDQWLETTTESYLWSADFYRPQPTVSFRDTAHPHTPTHTKQSTYACTLNMHKQRHTWTRAERKAGRRYAFYLGHIFRSYFINSQPSSLWLFTGLMQLYRPPHCSSHPSLKDCAFETNRLSSFSFSPHP